MSNSAIATQLLQKLSHLLEANKAYKSIQAEAYVIATKVQTNGQVGSLLNPCWIDHQSQGHREIPDDIFKLVEDFSSLTMSALQDVRNLQCEDDPTTRQKLVAGLERADRVASEIEEGFQAASKKAKYYHEVWGQKTSQWERDAKYYLDPGLPPSNRAPYTQPVSQCNLGSNRSYDPNPPGSAWRSRSYDPYENFLPYTDPRVTNNIRVWGGGPTAMNY
jgi:hypothetical protein